MTIRRAPLTFGQLSLWRSDQEIPPEKRPQWHFSRVWTVPAQTPESRVRTALTALVHRHESLRTLADPASDPPLQVVLPPTAPDHIVEPGSRPGTGDDTVEAARDVAAELAARPFDLASEPGWRALIVAGSAGEPRFVCLAFHHFVVDQWSLTLLESEFDVLVAADDPHRAAAELPAALQPTELSAEQHSAAWRTRCVAAERYWRRVLARYPHTGGTGAMSFGTGSGRIRATVTSPSLGPAVARVATAAGVTAQSAVLAVTLEALATFGVAPDEPLILMTANRFDPRARGMVGTQNQAAILAAPDHDGDFAEFAERVEWASRTAFRHGCYDFDAFTAVATEVRGAPVRYDYFFNHAVTNDTEPGDEPGDPAPPETTLGASPQSTGPRLDLRIYHGPALTFDVRVDPGLMSGDRLSEMVVWMYDRAHALATPTVPAGGRR